MLPAIGSVSALAGQGRVGVVVGARPIGEEEGGRQLVALRIREGEQAHKARTNPANDTITAGATEQGSGTVAPPGLTAGTEAADPSAASARRAVRLPNELSTSEKAAVSELRQRDQQVRQEEEAHAAVAGDLAGPISYTYQTGPDGRQYAVGGSVGIKAVVTNGDPEEAKRQAGRIAVAANAATNPSAQDFAVARNAYAMGSQLNIQQQADDRKGISLLS